MIPSVPDPLSLIRPRRRIEGFSAILLPFLSEGSVDWDGFRGHVRRTVEAGLGPAVNMDTGFGNLINEATKRHALEITRQECAGRSYVAGAFVGDAPGAAFARDAYARQMEMIQEFSGIPVIFQSHGLTGQPDDTIVAAYASLGALCDRFVGFELGTMFAPFGKIYSLDVFRGLMGVRSCIGAKHSSLRRDLEWQRLVLRDAIRPDFRVYTGNDLAIDMVMYGSDYLLGLSTFAPDVFARRDAAWAAGDPAFHELNDLLQYLGFLAFRPPVPAYKHSAAQFLKLRGWIGCDDTHPRSPRRPESDREILADIVARLPR
ncbi:MAG: dihydrodipicolinate synthase family protein [Verrucomicrobia bacterium]|nr:dihydrodipicolinate synthase family protein [Verrucomicrobiota bacterium]